jgi:Tol biopolymer transport system component
MHSNGLAISLVVLLELIFFQGSSAGPRTLDLKADLVAVVNMNPANPLGGEIWLMDLDGRVVQRITNNNYHEEYPSFSPDGTKIVFVRNIGGVVAGVGLDPKYNEIFVYDLRTGTETRLTRNDVDDGHPEWSFDGKYILFSSRRNHPEGRATLWVMESNGSHPRQILSLQPGDFSDLDPSWAPDGVWLTFVSQREEGDVRYSRVEKVRMDGTQRTVISSGGKHLKSSELELGDAEPAYSPDGAMIWSARRLEGNQIRLCSFSGGAYYGGKAEISMDWREDPDGIEQSPRFSPDGRRVVFTRSSPRAGYQSRQIVLTDPQSSFRRYLTSRENWDVWHPSWYPLAHSGAARESDSTVMDMR